jgi:hypothetical protein
VRDRFLSRRIGGGGRNESGGRDQGRGSGREVSACHR